MQMRVATSHESGSWVQGPFGGPRLRDRFTDGVWQGPTWSFAILLAALRLGEVSDSTSRALLLTGFGVVMVMTLIALVARWNALPVWSQMMLPLGDLLGALLMVVSDPIGAPTTLLLCALPVIWLAFEFGWYGMAVGIVATAAAASVPYLLHVISLRPQAPSADVVVPTLFVAGLAVVSRLMSRVLHGTNEILEARGVELVEALALSEARLVTMTGVMDSINAGVTVLIANDQPRHNERALLLADLAGLAPDSPRTPGSRIFAIDDRTSPVPPEEQFLQRAVAGEEFTALTQWIGEPAEQVALIASSRRLVRPSGEHLGMVVTAWDATELMDAIRAREDFVTTVSHELRTPLTAISASLELLDELVTEHHVIGPSRTAGTVDAEISWLLASCARNAALLDVRIAELLVSVPSHTSVIEPRTLDVSRLITLALSKHATATAAAQLTLTTGIQPDITAEVDPARFEQVVDNLMSNSIKYTPAGGDLRVTLCADEDCLVLGVSDTGTGMSPHEQRHAFDRFYCAPGAKAQAIQGLGIGLGLVKSIVERHGGTVELTSELHRGTTFIVSLPIRHLC